MFTLTIRYKASVRCFSLPRGGTCQGSAVFQIHAIHAIHAIHYLLFSLNGSCRRKNFRMSVYDGLLIDADLLDPSSWQRAPNIRHHAIDNANRLSSS